LGYEIFNKETELSNPRWTAEEIKQVNSKFKKRCIEKEPESVIVYLGSHGSHEELETSDGKPIVYWQHVINQLDHDNCLALKGVPKLFFIQACQLFEPDEKKVDNGKVEYFLDDYAIVQSTIPGHDAYRYPEIGAVMVHCLTEILMTNSHSHSFQQMMDMLREEVSKKCFRQTIRVEDKALKPLYFNLRPARQNK